MTKSIPAPRRFFFRYMARNTLVWCEEMCGVRHFALSDIPKLSPGAFAALIPRIRPGVEIVPEADRVCARLPGANELLPLFPIADAATLAVFNRLNGQITIGKASHELAGAMRWSAEESMARVRALFLRLVELRVCIPCNDMPEAGSASRNPGD